VPKKTGIRDIAESFFGDDELDWFDDEAAEEAPAQVAASETLVGVLDGPALPPPPEPELPPEPVEEVPVPVPGKLFEAEAAPEAEAMPRPMTLAPAEIAPLDPVPEPVPEPVRAAPQPTILPEPPEELPTEPWAIVAALLGEDGRPAQLEQAAWVALRRLADPARAEDLISLVKEPSEMGRRVLADLGYRGSDAAAAAAAALELAKQSDRPGDWWQVVMRAQRVEQLESAAEAGFTPAWGELLHLRRDPVAARRVIESYTSLPYLEAVRALLNDDPAEGLQHLGAVLEADPTNPHAAFLLLRAARYRAPGTAALLDTVAQAWREPAASVFRWLASSAWRDEDNDEARLASLKAGQGFGPARKLWSREALRVSDPKARLAAWEHQLPDNAPATLIRAAIALSSGLTDQVPELKQLLDGPFAPIAARLELAIPDRTAVEHGWLSGDPSALELVAEGSIFAKWRLAEHSGDWSDLAKALDTAELWFLVSVTSDHPEAADRAVTAPKGYMAAVRQAWAAQDSSLLPESVDSERGQALLNTTRLALGDQLPAGQDPTDPVWIARQDLQDPTGWSRRADNGLERFVASVMAGVAPLDAMASWATSEPAHPIVQAVLGANEDDPDARAESILAATWDAQRPFSADEIRAVAGSGKEPLLTIGALMSWAVDDLDAADMIATAGETDVLAQIHAAVLAARGISPSALRKLADRHAGHADTLWALYRAATHTGDRDLMMAVGQHLLALPGGDEKEQLLLHLPAELSAEQLAVVAEIAPTHPRALTAALASATDPAAIAELTKGQPAWEVAMLVDQLGDQSASVDAWRAAATEDAPLVAWFGFHAACEAAEEWADALVALDGLSARVISPQARALVDDRRHSILVERLGDSDAALAHFQAAVESRPDDIAAREALIQIAIERDAIEMATEHLDALAGMSLDDASALRVRVRRGELEEARGELDIARQAFMDVLDIDDSHGGARSALRRLARKREDWEELVLLLKQDAADASNPVSILEEIAHLRATHLSDPELTLEAWLDVTAIAPDNVTGLNAAFEIARTLNRFDIVERVGEALYGYLEGDDAASIGLTMGHIASENERDADALRWMERVADSHPSEASLSSLEALFRRRREWEKVVEVLQRQIALGDEHNTIARVLEISRIRRDQIGDREGAYEAFLRVLDQEPGNQEALRYVAAHQFATGNMEDAGRSYETLIPLLEEADVDDFEEVMENTRVFYRHGRCLEAAGNLDAALGRYEEAIELCSSHVATLRAFAPLLAKVGQFERAEQAYRSLLALTSGSGEPDDQRAAVYTELGDVELKLGKLEKAFKRFTRARDLHPGFVGALEGRAKVFEAREMWEEMLVEYNWVIQNAQDRSLVVRAYNTKGRVLDRQRGRVDAARLHYERSLSFDPNQAVAYWWLSEIAARTSDWDRVRECGVRGLALNEMPEAVKARLHVAMAGVSLNSNDMSSAQAHLAHAARGGIDVEPNLTAVAAVLKELGGQDLPA